MIVFCIHLQFICISMKCRQKYLQSEHMLALRCVRESMRITHTYTRFANVNTEQSYADNQRSL